MTMNMYRKKCIRILVLCAGLAFLLLTGCGGEYATHTSGGGEGVSGTAINVSGQAVFDDSVQSMGEKHRFCSDSQLYYMDNRDQEHGDILFEHALADGSERQIKIENLCELWYADNDWVYYEKLVEESEEDVVFLIQFCRAPVEDGRMNEKKEEVLFEKGHISILYCDGRYVLYDTYTSPYDDEYTEYDIYDIKEKEHFIGGKDSVEVLAVIDGSAFICGCLDGTEAAMYRQDLNSRKISKISDEYAAGGTIAYTESEFFYLDSYADHPAIWNYHLSDDNHLKNVSKEKIVTDTQIKDFLMQEGFLDDSRGEYPDYFVERLFLYGERLYVQVEIFWFGSDMESTMYRNKVVFSTGIKNGEGIRYEKELTRCLANPEKNQKVVDKYFYRGTAPTVFLSRGTCIGMVEDKCFMRLYHTEKKKNMLAYYDLLTGELKYLTKKDSEWYRLLYDGMLPKWWDVHNKIPGDNSMPNNQDDIGYLW